MVVLGNSIGGSVVLRDGENWKEDQEYEAVELCLQNLDHVIESFRLALEEVDKQINWKIKRKELKKIGAIIQQVRTAKQACLLEIRALKEEGGDGDARSFFEDAFNSKMSDVNGLLRDYEWKKSEVSRDELVQKEADALESGDTGGAGARTDEMTREQLVLAGDHVQDQTQHSLNRIKVMVGDTEQLGDEITDKLDLQTEQMMGIREGLDDVDYNLKRAKQTMKSIAKNAASDRCTQILCCLVVLFFIAAVALVAIPDARKPVGR